MAKFFLKPLAWAADVVIVGEVRRTSVAARTERVHLLRSIIQEFPAPRYEADLGALPGERERNDFADTAAGRGHHSNLIVETVHDLCCGPRPLAAQTVVCRIPLRCNLASFSGATFFNRQV